MIKNISFENIIDFDTGLFLFDEEIIFNKFKNTYNPKLNLSAWNFPIN